MFSWDNPHAIYISVVELELKEDVLVGNVKVFSDDLVSALRNYNKHSTSTELQVEELEIENYFNDHFKISNNEDGVTLELLKIERLGDSHWLNFEIELNSQFNTIDIQASYFFELFPTQKNILSIKGASANQYFTFKSKDQTETINLRH